MSIQYSNIVDDSPELQRASAGAGTKAWAKDCKSELEYVIDTINRGKARFSSRLADFIKYEGWKNFIDERTDDPFPTFRAFALAKRPNGLGASPEQLDLLMDAYKKNIEDWAWEVMEKEEIP